MKENKITVKSFLNCFKNFDFNILKKESKESKDSSEHSEETVRDTISQLSKMLQKARKGLARAYKEHKAGKISSDELYDREWHVHELESALKNIEDKSK